MNRIKYLLALPLFSIITMLTDAQPQQKITPLTGEINFDGKPDEVAWQQIPKFEMIMHYPVFGNTPSEDSDIRITYDKDFLWVGAVLYYKDISNMVSTSKKRDETSDNSDSFGIILDTYDDNENALAFFTMPSGLKIDYTVSNDGVGRGGPNGESTNYTWNTFWDVKTAKDENAWYIEMRIPFSSLRFQSADNLTRMGLIINRRISYLNEIITYPAIDTRYGQDARIKPSLASPVYFENLEPHNPVYISPYLLGGFTREYSPDAEGNFVKIDNPKYTGGLDVKYNLNSNLTLDFTVNTDFAQVEADDQQVNLTRYSLFFPEKRLFFQERSSIFSFNLGGPQELFYSRRIGLLQGEPVRILGGARLVGRVGNWDVGFLNMNTEKFNGNPAENFGVARVRKQVLNPNSYVGAILSTRAGFDGNYNASYGIDGIFRLFGDDYLDIKLAQTIDKGMEAKLVSADPTYFAVNWERRNDQGLSYIAKYAYSGLNFNPGTGFMFTQKFQEYRGELLYGFFPKESAKVFKHRLSLDFAYVNRLIDGKLENFELAPQYVVNWKNGFSLFNSLNFLREGVFYTFYLSDDVFVPEGNYFFANLFGSFGTPQNKAVAGSFEYEIGEFYDGNHYAAGIIADLNLSASLQVTGYYKFNRINFPERSQQFTNNLARLKLTYMLNTKISASSYIQFNENDNLVVTNFRLRYNPADGNDFYLVFNDLRNISDSQAGIKTPAYLNRTLLLKYTHTFRL
jgi:hypothetical protein